MSDEIKKYPEATIGILIYNDEGKILLARGKKFGDSWVIPGGHVEIGETCEEAVIRETKEEVALDIDKIEFLEYQDAINPTGFINQRHYIFLDFAAKYVSGEVVLNDELEEFVWIEPLKALETLLLAKSTLPPINGYLEKIRKDPAFAKAMAGEGKKSIFHRSCKDCEKNKAEVEEYKNDWQRALADYKNLQREVEKRRSEWAQLSELQIIEEFLPVYDNFKKAFATNDANSETNSTNDGWRQGIGYIMKQFGDVLKAHNIEEIKTVGEKFDPGLHEAGGEAEVEDKESGEIIREVTGGYKMGGKVIRAARVIVSK